MIADPLAYLLGVEGVALMRAFAGEHDAAFIERRVDRIRELIAQRDRLGRVVDVPEIDMAAGYDAWAPTYDSPGNRLLALDEEHVLGLVDGLPAGDALDVACGTGRYAGLLAERGWRVVAGVDASARMLAVARERHPGTRFVHGDLQALPVPEASVDLVVCALALTHLPTIDAAYAEFARVLRPGGQVVVSDTIGLYLGSRRYPLADGSFGYLPGWQHTAEEHLSAATAAGLEPRALELERRSRMVEPEDESLDLAAEPVADPWALMTVDAEAADAAYADAPMALWLKAIRPH